MGQTAPKILLVILAALLAFGSMTTAQDLLYGDEFDWDAYEPYGTWEAAYEPYDDAEAGAIILRQSTPTDQNANFDVVGPDDYWEHLDFSDNPGDEVVLDDLPPGFYSVAATDEGLELAHTVVEVRRGEAVAVAVNLGAYDPDEYFGVYAPYAYYGTYAGYEDAYPGYPFGAYTVGPYEPYGVATAGSIAISDVPDGVDVIITGPNGYSESFEGDAITEALPPGVYAIAASGEGTDLSVTTVEIQVGMQLLISPLVVELD